MIATVGTVGLAEWIIDDSSLVIVKFTIISTTECRTEV